MQPVANALLAFKSQRGRMTAFSFHYGAALSFAVGFRQNCCVAAGLQSFACAQQYIIQLLNSYICVSAIEQSHSAHGHLI